VLVRSGIQLRQGDGRHSSLAGVLDEAVRQPGRAAHMCGIRVRVEEKDQGSSSSGTWDRRSILRAR
jgi:hypothetical protein